MMEYYLKYITMEKGTASFSRFCEVTTKVGHSTGGDAKKVVDSSEGTQTSIVTPEDHSSSSVKFFAQISYGTHEENILLAHSQVKRNTVDKYIEEVGIAQFWAEMNRSSSLSEATPT